MRRRAFLATAGTALLGTLAGCAHPNGSLVMRAVDDDAALSDRYARDAADASEDRRRLVAAAVAGESITREGVSPPFDPDRPVAYEGAYYRITHEVVDERSDVRYGIEVDYGPGTPVAERGTVEYANLPEADRRALDGLIPPERDVSRVDDEDVTLGKGYVYPPDAESVFVPDQQFDVVVHEGTRYGVAVGDPTDVTVKTYRYAAEEVAGSDAELASRLRDRYLFELTDLSEAEREIVAEAIDGGYYLDGSAGEGFRSLIERFRAREGIEVREGSGTWIVRYDGTVYWTEASYPFVDGTLTATA